MFILCQCIFLHGSGILLPLGNPFSRHLYEEWIPCKGEKESRRLCFHSVVFRNVLRILFRGVGVFRGPSDIAKGSPGSAKGPPAWIGNFVPPRPPKAGGLRPLDPTSFPRTLSLICCKLIVFSHDINAVGARSK